MEAEAKCDPQFINRVLNLPVVAAATDQVSEVYSRTKASHTAVKYTMETAENLVKYGAQTTQPLLEKPLMAMDNFACEQLNKLETNYEIISKQTEEILDASKNAFQDAKNYSAAKVNEMKNYSYETVTNIKSYSLDKAQYAKKYSTEKVTAVLESEMGKQVFQEVDKIVTLTERYFDMLIPPSECEREMGVTSEAPKRTVERLAILSNKAHYRLHCLAIQQLDKLRSIAEEKIEELKAILCLLKEKTVASVKTYNERVQITLLELTKSDDGNQSQETMQEKLLQKVRMLTKTLTDIFKQVSNIMTYVSSVAMEKFVESHEGVGHLYETFKKVSNVEDISETTITHSQEILGQLQNFLRLLANEIQSSTLNLLNKRPTHSSEEIELLPMSTEDVQPEQNPTS